MDTYNICKRIVVTKDILQKQSLDEKNIMFIPAWLFLLSLDTILTMKKQKEEGTPDEKK